MMKLLMLLLISPLVVIAGLLSYVWFGILSVLNLIVIGVGKLVDRFF